MSQQKYFIVCQIGFEEMVKQELLHLLFATLPEYADSAAQHLPLEFKFSKPAEREQAVKQLVEQFQVQIKVGGVAAKLPQRIAYQMMIWSRVASRVLLVLNETYCATDIDLYNAVYAYPWQELVEGTPDFMVNFNGTSGEIKNSRYGALRVKDAFVDNYTNKGLTRPQVSTDEPMMVIDCRLNREQLMLSLDLTGTLHKRYRAKAGLAPMRETLAANLILRTGWDKQSPVYNPMCGSGVLAIEAALIALNIAPGLYFFQHNLGSWKQHDPELWLQVRSQAHRSRLTPEEINPEFKVYASDNDKAVLSIAVTNARAVEVAEYIEFSFSAFDHLQRSEQAESGLIIINPPYGVRLASERVLYATYYKIAEVCRNLFPGWILGVISSSEKLLDCIFLRAQRSWKVRNSNLDCQFRIYAIRGNLATSESKTATPKRTLTFKTKVGTDTAANSLEVTSSAESQSQASAILSSSTTESKPESAFAVNATSEGNKTSLKAKSKDSTPAKVEDLVKPAPESKTAEELAQENALLNRLRKNFKRLKSYLKRNQVANFRLYDADIPEFNVAVDHYQDVKTKQRYFVVQEYAAAKDIPLHKAVKRSLQALVMVQLFAKELKSSTEAEPIVIDKLRERKKGEAQYTRIAEEKLEFWVNEYGLDFKVNLTDYIDTGIFLDNRDLRKFLQTLVKEQPQRFLNLFSYTSTATAHAIAAGAKESESVDLSNSYCRWSVENFLANFPKLNAQKHRVVQADVLQWLALASKERAGEFSVIFCDPPTFSNSKRMEDTFDVQRDHLKLLEQITQLLTPTGKLVFCNNKRGFKLEQATIESWGFKVQDITHRTMPEDFKGSKIHQAWLISRQ